MFRPLESDDLRHDRGHRSRACLDCRLLLAGVDPDALCSVRVEALRTRLTGELVLARLTAQTTRALLVADLREAASSASPEVASALVERADAWDRDHAGPAVPLLPGQGPPGQDTIERLRGFVVLLRLYASMLRLQVPGSEIKGAVCAFKADGGQVGPTWDLDVFLTDLVALVGEPPDDGDTDEPDATSGAPDPEASPPDQAGPTEN